jgi:hypothetical protein
MAMQSATGLGCAGAVGKKHVEKRIVTAAADRAGEFVATGTATVILL